MRVNHYHVFENVLNEKTVEFALLRLFCRLLEEPIFLQNKDLKARDSTQYGIYFLPTSRQYNAELPSQNRN